MVKMEIKCENRVGTEFNQHNILVERIEDGKVTSPNIGEDTWVGYFVLLDGSGGLEIGKHCSISSGVHVYTHDAVRWATQNLEKDGEHLDKKPVMVGNNVFIGANSVILKGVTIEDGAIIGAGSIVLEDTHIGKGEVWAGNPAKKIK